ncbi:MAG: MMPL family transporter, partial [Actinobacteria bacterium]|nr:MMPL family transporter [Actinomycetota bacterium]
MQTLARFAIRHRWWIIGAWLAFVILAQGIASSLGGANYKDTFSLPNTETATVANLLKQAGLDNQNGISGTVVIHNKSDAAFTSAPTQLQPALSKLCTSGNRVVLVASPWQSIDCSKGGASTAGNPQLLNSDHGSNTALVNITWQNNHYDVSQFKNVYDSLKKLNSSSLEVEFTGNAFAGIGQSSGSSSSIFIGFGAALIILAIVFRTVAATALPLASAIVALVSGLGVIEILSHAINVSNITPYLSELMVIGVGVDYALFIVTRHRRNLRRGMPVSESIVTAINTSGRAVLFAGTTVCIAILGLIALGVT